MTTDEKPPQYTAFAATASPAPPAVEEDELARRCRLWREKNPQRAAALRRVVAPVLGCNLESPAGEKLIAAFCEPLENKLLAAFYGIEERENG